MIYMAITAFKRCEHKFLITSSQADELLSVLSRHMLPDKHCANGSLYTVYNIYYDTPDNEIIRHSVSKPYYKEKLRLRSYCTNPSPDGEVFLEMKKKLGKVVNKRRVVLSCKQAMDFAENGVRPKAADFMSEQVINEIEYFLKRNRVAPAVYISCKRSAFFDRDDPDIRITLDRDILTRRDNLTFNSGRYGKELIAKDERLMEIKIPDAYPLWLSSALSELKIYKTSFSKYGREYESYLLSPEIPDLHRSAS